MQESHRHQFQVLARDMRTCCHLAIGFHGQVEKKLVISPINWDLFTQSTHLHNGVHGEAKHTNFLVAIAGKVFK